MNINSTLINHWLYCRVLAFNYTYVVFYLYEYFTTAISERFSTVSRVDVYNPRQIVDILHSHFLIVNWCLLSFVHVWCFLLCDDRASCKAVCAWWVIPYIYVLIKKIKTPNKMLQSMAPETSEVLRRFREWIVKQNKGINPKPWLFRTN